MKSPICFECNSEMIYLGNQRRSIKVRVGKGEIPRKERRFYHIWFCENGHKRREHYTKGRPQRYSIQELNFVSWRCYWTCSSIDEACQYINSIKRLVVNRQFNSKLALRVRDNWEGKFIKCF